MLELPDHTAFEAVTDVEASEFPEFSRVKRHRDSKSISDVEPETERALAELPEVGSLLSGATVTVTAGSRGIQNIVPTLRTVVAELERRGLDPFMLPAMGSHGGATAAGQRELLETLAITEESMGCDIQSSMDVDRVATDSVGRDIYAASDAIDADAVLLINRIKIHTDFVNGNVESGLCKMAVIGLGELLRGQAPRLPSSTTRFASTASR